MQRFLTTNSGVTNKMTIKAYFKDGTSREFVNVESQRPLPGNDAFIEILQIGGPQAALLPVENTEYTEVLA